MNALFSQLSRVAFLVYVAVLWVGVIPVKFLSSPTLGVARTEARALLRAVGLTPGDAIFASSPTEWKIAINCLRITGTIVSGFEQPAYENECPNRAGFRLRNSAFDQTLQQLTRLTIRPAVRARSHPADRLRDISDYYCHSSLEEPRGFTSVTLRQTIYLRSAWSGDTFRNPTLRCEMSCARDASAPRAPRAPRAPQCELRGRLQQVGIGVDAG